MLFAALLVFRRRRRTTRTFLQLKNSVPASAFSHIAKDTRHMNLVLGGKEFGLLAPDSVFAERSPTGSVDRKTTLSRFNMMSSPSMRRIGHKQLMINRSDRANGPPRRRSTLMNGDEMKRLLASGAGVELECGENKQLVVIPASHLGVRPGSLSSMQGDTKQDAGSDAGLDEVDGCAVMMCVPGRGSAGETQFVCVGFMEASTKQVSRHASECDGASVGHRFKAQLSQHNLDSLAVRVRSEKAIATAETSTWKKMRAKQKSHGALTVSQLENPLKSSKGRKVEQMRNGKQRTARMLRASVVARRQEELHALRKDSEDGLSRSSSIGSARSQRGPSDGNKANRTKKKAFKPMTSPLSRWDSARREALLESRKKNSHTPGARRGGRGGRGGRRGRGPKSVRSFPTAAKALVITSEDLEEGNTLPELGVNPLLATHAGDECEPSEDVGMSRRPLVSRHSVALELGEEVETVSTSYTERVRHG